MGFVLLLILHVARRETVRQRRKEVKRRQPSVKQQFFGGWGGGHGLVATLLFFFDAKKTNLTGRQQRPLLGKHSQTEAKPREVAVISKLKRDYSSAKQEVVSGGLWVGGGGASD